MNKLSFFSLTMSFISLMAFWVAMSGFLDLVHLAMGVVTVVGVMALNYKLKQHHFFEDDMDDLSELRFGRAFFYFFWMIYQILVAGFHVLMVIIRPAMPIKPTLVTFKVDLPSAHAKMILGNSITLTPGTLTVDIEDDLFTVHALDSNSYAGIADDTMPRQVLSLFSKENRPVVRDFKILTPEN
ncbi:MAG: Na+/H+ antiporter subunit E [Bacteroidota bacterium]